MNDPEKLPPVECTYCKRFGHPTENCIRRLRSIGLLVEWPRSGQKDGQKKGKRMLVAEKEGKTVVASASTETVRTLLFTLVLISGIRFPRCLIDTGSEVNIISVKDATKHGLAFTPGGVLVLKDFNNDSVPVQGQLTANLSIGRGSNDRTADFLVTSNTSVPIIGLPTLKAFGLSVDCAAHELRDTSTGNVVRCSAVNVSPKN